MRRGRRARRTGLSSSGGCTSSGTSRTSWITSTSSATSTASTPCCSLQQLCCCLPYYQLACLRWTACASLQLQQAHG